MGRSIVLLFLLLVALKTYCQDSFPPLPSSLNSDNKRIFEKVDFEATFPGGEVAYKTFLESNLQYIIDTATSKKIRRRTYTIDLIFLIDTSGNVFNAKATSKPQEKFLESECEKMIRQSPQWQPARQNGRAVKAVRRQPLTIVI